jgi:flagellar protein FlgJ
MSTVRNVSAISPALDSRDARLRKAAQQMEGVFLEQLFKAMRETVPEGELARGGSGEEIFTGLLDQKLADVAAAGGERGLGAAIYRQLRGYVQNHSTEEGGTR